MVCTLRHVLLLQPVIDLIYEGIETFPLNDGPIILSFAPVIDLIYEGIETPPSNAAPIAGVAAGPVIDLIYEGIETSIYILNTRLNY